MTTVYVASRYRAPTVNGIHENITQARRCAVDLWKAGLCALTPHLNSAFMDGVAPDAVFLEGGLELLRRCDALVVVVDEEKWSDGVRAEIDLAKQEGMPLYFWGEDGDGERIAEDMAERTDLRSVRRV